MGSKTSMPAPQLPPRPVELNFEELMAPVLGILESSMAQNTSILTALLPQPELPEIETTPSVDWAAKEDELRNASKVAVNDELNRKVTRGNTIYTSPLLDTEDVETTSILASGS